MFWLLEPLQAEARTFCLGFCLSCRVYRDGSRHRRREPNARKVSNLRAPDDDMRALMEEITAWGMFVSLFGGENKGDFGGAGQGSVCAEGPGDCFFGCGRAYAGSTAAATAGILWLRRRRGSGGNRITASE